MKKLGLFLLLLIALAVGALLLAPRFITTETLVAQAEGALSKSLGREVSIGTVENLKLFPVAGVDITALEIANAPGMTAPYFLQVGAAQIQVKLLPVLLPPHNIEITALILDRPDIRLEKSKNGSTNWVLATRDDPAERTEKDPDGAQTAPTDIADSFDARLGDVRIIKGQIIYRDGESGQVFEAAEADLDIDLERLSAPLRVTGDMMFQQTPATLNLTLGSPAALLKNEAAQLDLKFSLGENAVEMTVNITGGDLRYTGGLNIDAPSLRALLRALGMQLEADTGFDSLTIAGDISGTDTRLAFDDAAFVFDAITGRGAIAFDWGGKRSKITGEVQFSDLDLRPYTPAPTDEEKAARADKSADFPPWSESPVDFSFLGNLDLDVSGSSDAITLHTIAVGKSALRLRVDGGKLRADLTDLTLYGGSGKGILALDAAGRTPRLDLDFTLNGLDAKGFAADALGINRLSGTGSLAIDLSTQGTSQAAFMRNLSGDGDFTIDNGTIEGVNLAEMVSEISNIVSNYKTGRIDPARLVSLVATAQGEDAVTAFEVFKAGFTAAGGQLNSRDISIIAPFFTMSGEGGVDLPGQQIDLTLSPSLTQDAEREGRALGAPIRIAGSFNDPKIRVDTSSLVRNAAESKLRELFEKEDIETEEGEGTEEGELTEETEETENSAGEEDEAEESLEDIAKRKAAEKIFDLFGQ